ncbi:MAG: AAA family ATPase [Methylococcales bacterium]|nr:AAA family ATPase [Methylococcales bacterium]
MKLEGQNFVDTYDLISLARMDAFDLLVQGILNQREALIICGAKGIGKTTLLKTLKKHKEEVWAICFFQGTEPLSFGEIKHGLVIAIKAHGSIPDAESLDDMLYFYEEHQQKVVLILDNVERLSSGFIDKLIRYALQHPAIKLIFSLTKKELSLKSRTDIMIDNCYFIELPRLEKQDLRPFLQRAALMPEGLIAEVEINDKLINKLYPLTAGIPGKIITELQKQDGFWFKWQRGVVFASCLVIGVGLVYRYHSVFEKINLDPSFFTDALEDKLINKKEVIAVLSNKPEQDNSPKDINALPLLKSDKKISENEKIIEDEKVIEREKLVPPKKQADSDDSAWVLQQKPKGYSLQLMVTSKKKSLLQSLKNYPHLPHSLNYVRVIRKNRPLYILLYGAFPTAKTAQKAVKTLPKVFKNAWPKRFDSIQAEIKKVP